MRHFLLLTISIFLVSSCVYENEEETYYSTPGNLKNSLDSGLIAHFCFQNSLVDSSKNNVSGTYNGTPVYEDAISIGSVNKAIRFNGTDNYFEISIGQYGTVAISIFFKTDGALSTSQKPYLLDYGQDALALNLDAVSGGTYMVVNNQTLNNPEENWISSFDGWNHLYIEAELSTKQFRVIYNSSTKTDLVISSVASNPMTLNSGSIIIGRSSSGTSGDNYFKGLIDDIRIYNRKLSNTELHQISKVLQ